MEISIMKTNKWILGGLMAMAITACTSDELVENTNPTQGRKVTVTAYAPGDEANSRVSFADDNTSTVTLSWKEGDKFSVVCGTNVETFSKTAEDNTFSGVLPTSATSPASYYAFYPALEEEGEEEEEEAILTAANTVPFDLSTQTGALDESKTYMRASSTDGLTYNFVHCTAILKATFSNVNFTGNTKIKEVKVLLPNDNATGTINLAEDGALTGATGNNIITINYPEPVAAATAAYIYLPPMAKENKKLAFVVTTEDEKKYTGTLAGSNYNDIVAGNIYKAEITVASANFLTFTAKNDGQSLKMSTAVLYLQYSTDGLTWKNLGTSTVDFVNKQLFLRGKNTSGTNTATISFGKSDVKVACSGDIRTLVDYTNYTTITNAGNAKFKNLFKDCTVLTSAPELPFTTLADECYWNMFYGCTALTSAPALPAESLASDCYRSMFYGCTALTSAPTLPATILAEYCYMEMFKNCKLLAEAPALPAESLAANCYDSMFSRCTSLAEAPALPAESLAEWCYYNMFYGCTSLKEAPELPATILASNCYNFMFRDCKALITAPITLPAESLAIRCYNSMFLDCTSLTTAPVLKAKRLSIECCESMFQGCTSLAEAPALPATALGASCYRYMFKGCTALTTAPITLPAESLALECYRSMFEGCTALTSAPVLPATTLAEYCYAAMFKNCTSLNSVTMLATNIEASSLSIWLDNVSPTGTFTKAAGVTIKINSSSGIPSGWIVTQPSELPGIGDGGNFEGITEC